MIADSTLVELITEIEFQGLVIERDILGGAGPSRAAG